MAQSPHTAAIINQSGVDPVSPRIARIHTPNSTIPFHSSRQHIDAELPDRVRRIAQQCANDLSAHYVRLHTQLQISQMDAMAELKTRAQASIACVQKQLVPQLQTSRRHVEHVLTLCDSIKLAVPANVSVPKLIGELHMWLERTACTLSYDVDAQFR